ncbi:hypothetical protein CPB83DRAFT_174704 [Crepidotus variabilis]|uniref:Uncharacterized protein n=1 Tax=Crepidotus variabilis TaxID=179855 RepID=A0A9P6EK30_9AGAR|nr:hypothetical protein CPB83DRAFT_174704 [Crepidotus variabilis]
MTLPSLAKLEESAKIIVWKAKKLGKLKEYTPRLIRQTLEKEYDLDEGALDEAEYKSAIKNATKVAMSEPSLPIEDDENFENASKSASPLNKKRKTDKDTDDDVEPQAKAKGKAAPVKRQKVPAKDDGDSGIAKKKRRVSTTKKKAISEDESDGNKAATPSPRPKRQKPKSKKDPSVFKSAEHVPTSDIEPDQSELLPASKAKDVSSSSPSSKKKPPSSKAKAPPEAGPSIKPKPTNSEDQDMTMKDAGEKSESEMSVLIDEPPKRKRKSSISDKKSTKQASKPRTKKETPALSKDEETIKKLKGLVFACGQRKAWSKVFQGLDTSQQQIKKLKEMLTDLGMTGRMSMEQARAIKEKREFEQELEDVKAFAKAVEGRSSRSRGGSGKGKSKESESEDGEAAAPNEIEDKSDDEDDAPRKRSVTARKSIMAFLQDQSSDEN